MSTPNDPRSTLADKARLAAKIAPVVLVAIRAFRSARDHREAEAVGRSSIPMQHEHRHGPIVTSALIGGALIGGVAALLLAPSSGADNRAAVHAQLEQRWPGLDRVLGALRAARDAALHVFRDELGTPHATTG
jgi:hypothetical protein